jgi:hypothetical protein
LALTGTATDKMLLSVIDAGDADGVKRILDGGFSVEMDKSKACKDYTNNEPRPMAPYYNGGADMDRNNMDLAGTVEGLDVYGATFLWPGACSSLYMLRAVSRLQRKTGDEVGAPRSSAVAAFAFHPVFKSAAEQARSSPYGKGFVGEIEAVEENGRKGLNMRRIMEMIDARTPIAEKVLYPSYVWVAMNRGDLDTAGWLLSKYEEAYPAIGGLNYAANPKWAAYTRAVNGPLFLTTGSGKKSLGAGSALLSETVVDSDLGRGIKYTADKVFQWSIRLLHGPLMTTGSRLAFGGRFTTMVEIPSAVKATSMNAPGGLPLVHPDDLRFLVFRDTAKKLALGNGHYGLIASKENANMMVTLQDLSKGHRYADDNGYLYSLPVGPTTGHGWFMHEGASAKETRVWWARQLFASPGVKARINAQDDEGRTLIHSIARQATEEVPAANAGTCSPASVIRWVAEAPETNVGLLDTYGLTPVGYTASLPENHPVKAALMLQDYSKFTACSRDEVRAKNKR